MTGKELIMEIINRDLLDKTLYINDIFPGYISDVEAAARFNVGIPTIRVWCKEGFFEYFKTDKFYFIRDKHLVDPRKKGNSNENKKDISSCTSGVYIRVDCDDPNIRIDSECIEKYIKDRYHLL